MATEIQTPVGRAPVIPVLLLGAGFYLAWFGVHYFKHTRPDGSTLWPSDPVKSVLTGKPLQTSADPSAQEIVTQVESVPSAGGTASGTGATVTGSGATSTGSAIADDALKYVGAGYVWGGNASAPGDWDCSSFVSYVLGFDLHMALPGGGTFGDAGYPPGSHGPTTNSYLLYGTPINYGSELPGDLVVTSVHMGIVIGGGRMVSAQDPQLGTGIATYQSGFPGGTPQVRRISTAVNAPQQGQAPATGGHP